jgi:hypothetical protein
LYNSKGKRKATIRDPVSKPIIRAKNTPAKEDNTVRQHPGLTKITSLALDTKPEISIDLDFIKDVLKPTDKQIDNTKGTSKSLVLLSNII